MRRSRSSTARGPRALRKPGRDLARGMKAECVNGGCGRQMDWAGPLVFLGAQSSLSRNGYGCLVKKPIWRNLAQRPGSRGKGRCSCRQHDWAAYCSQGRLPPAQHRIRESRPLARCPQTAERERTRGLRVGARMIRERSAAPRWSGGRVASERSLRSHGDRGARGP